MINTPTAFDKLTKGGVVNIMKKTWFRKDLYQPYRNFLSTNYFLGTY